MLLYIVCAFVVATSLYLKIAKYLAHAKLIDKFPGPPKLPLIGNAHQFSQNPTEILDKLFEWWREFGKDKYRLWIGTYSNIILSNEKDIAAVLTSNTLIQKSDIYDLLHPWLGTGLLTSSGSKWHKHRKIITPTFHFNVLVDFLVVMNRNSTKFVEKLRQASAGGKIFDVQEMVSFFTLDVICETAMGVKVNAMDVHDSAFVKAVQYMCFSIQTRAFNPFKRNQFLFKFTSEYRKYKQALKILQDFTYDVINKRRYEVKREENVMHGDDAQIGGRKKQVFLDVLLSAEVENRTLTLNELYEEVSTFIFEGHDTTASGIAFAIYLLSRHPSVQQKVLAEQKQIFGDDINRDATYQEISEMKFLDNVIKECQRLYPSVPAIARYTDSDFNMNGMIIPKGTTVEIFIMSTGYNDQQFPDPYKFDPERFNFSAVREQSFSRFSYVPFSAGPRNCIGQKFAMLELKSTIAKIVRNFEILPPLDELVSTDGYVTNFCGLSKEEQEKKKRNHYDPRLSAVLVLKSDNGIHIRLRERYTGSDNYENRSGAK